MPKLDLETIPPVLRDFVTTPPEALTNETVVKIQKAFEKVAKEEKADRDANREPKQKFEHVILLSDPTGVIPKGTELVGWVTKIKEGEDPGSVLDRIIRGIRNFNLSKKGKKSPATSIGDGIEGATRKFFKAEEIQVLTKESVRIVFTDNVLPTDKVKPAPLD